MTVDDANFISLTTSPRMISAVVSLLTAPLSTLSWLLCVSFDILEIVNDQSVRGKCYGFVTFSNRRSAYDAIQEWMENIGGRVVRVNEVTTRFGGWLNTGGQGRFQPQSPDGRSDFGYKRDRFSDRSRERDRTSLELNNLSVKLHLQERAYEHSHGLERRNDHDMLDRNGYKERVFQGVEDGDWRGYSSNMRISGTSSHQGRNEETKREDREAESVGQKGSEKGTAKTSKPLVKGFVHDNDDEVMKITKVLKNKRGGDPLFSEIHMSRLDQAMAEPLPRVKKMSGQVNVFREACTMPDGGRGRDGKDHFSNSSGDHSFQVKEELEALTKTRDVLHDEVLVMEERLEVKEDMCSELQKNFKRLEDLLNNEKKLTSQRRKELAKLHKSYSRVRECSDNLKGCEQELQSLVNSAAREGVAGADEGLENGCVVQGVVTN
ncbi:unnamed protein product [Brassica napus]|uniref:(rape) hypothetical protein n=1 Tax=Brassica napus TaxID=3708 RepID=A0A816UYY7_BRANA|nr:unnamed protein product [Brassica napus]